MNIDLLVQTALEAKADAIHPGYGYLSENARFADAVRAAGIIFIGPSSSAINTLGDKREAKEYLSKHEPSVPLIPGYTGSSQGVQLSDLQEQSEKIGFPIMVKASAGGGGKGLRIVHEASALETEFNRAQSEAQRSFGLGDCILEKYIEAGKHVEVQILGDSHGKVVSLWERDCSVQRRHQKIIEESPCPWLSQEKREDMCAVAVKIGELLRYEGAGTVEFILDLATGKFYFLEVNARLQVEHPITEECTNLDIVSLQLYVASGGSLAQLPRIQNIPQIGHAIECRLCAEDPSRDFSPQHGLIRVWSPASVGNQEHVRFETAIESGARVSIYFDSMIAKIVVWAPTRAMAIEKMSRVLAETVCIGVSTNQLFLQACLNHEGFRRVDYSTAFIPSNLDSLLASLNPANHGLPLDLYSIVPSLFSRRLRGQDRPKSMFGNVRLGFRNQTFDKVNALSDIITRYNYAQGKDEDPQICRLDFNPDPKTQRRGLSVKIAPLPEVSSNTEEGQEELSGSVLVTKAYNSLSASLRSGKVPNESEYPVNIHFMNNDSIKFEGGTTCETGRVEISVGRTKIQGIVATGDSFFSRSENDTGGYLKLFCHFPTIGAPLEYRCYSALSYYESQRVAAAGSEAAAGIISAPMPCKVLQILKKSGDQVKVGEVVMIIESMKMEITITASKDGVFEPSVEEGQAVNEGVKMCSFE